METKTEKKMTITLIDGNVVELDCNLSLFEMRKAQNEGLISKQFLNELMGASKDPTKMNFTDMENAPYIAYRNANPNNAMSRDEFFKLLPYDIEIAGDVFTRMIGGAANKQTMAQSFNKAVRSGKKGKGKKYQK